MGLNTALCFSAHGAEAKQIKFATLAPEGSTWMKVMEDINKELTAKTGGQLKLKIYPGGTMGDEKDVVRKIRVGQLHSAGFTGVGLGEIAPQVRILDAPWLFRNVKEVDHVYQNFNKDLTEAIEKAGYVLLGWTELGFVYVFSKDPINGPEDMKKAKMWVWEGDPIAESAYRAMGVAPKPLSVVDVMTSLQTGLIDAVYGPPAAVNAMQWFTRAKHIYRVPLASACGAALISKKFFDTLPADQQKILKEVSASNFRRLTELTRQDNDKALEAFKKNGLILSAAPTPEQEKLFQDLGRKARRELAGKLYSAELLDRVEKSLEQQRLGKAKKG